MSILRSMQSSRCTGLQCAATTEEDNYEWLVRAGDCATVAYSKSTRSAVINHSRPGRERERRLRKSAAPPINVNDLFLQRTSRRITVSYVIAPVFFVYVRACCFSFRLTRLISNKRKTTCRGYSGTDLSSILRSLSDTFVLFPLQVTLTSVFYGKQLRLYFFENLEPFNNSLYVYILYIFSKRLKQNKYYNIYNIN